MYNILLVYLLYSKISKITVKMFLQYQINFTNIFYSAKASITQHYIIHLIKLYFQSHLID